MWASYVAPPVPVYTGRRVGSGLSGAEEKGDLGKKEMLDKLAYKRTSWSVPEKVEMRILLIWAD